MRRINQAGIDLIKHFEGMMLTAYKCPAGIWTIGIGHTGPDVSEGLTITEPRAIDLLHRDLNDSETAVMQQITVPLNDNQFAALVSFTFNCGAGALNKSTLRKKLNAGEYSAVPAELMKWVRGGGKVLSGLVKRRTAEAELWNL